MNYSSKIVIFLALAGAAVFFLNREDQRGSFQQKEDLGFTGSGSMWTSFKEDPGLWATTFWHDWLVGNAGDLIREPEVTFIRVDGPDKESFEDWPPIRLDWAVILNVLEAQEASTVGIVPPLVWEDTDTLAQSVLKTQLLRMPPLVVGGVLAPAADEGSATLDPSKFVTLDQAEGDRTLVPEVGQIVVHPDDELLINGVAAFSQVELHENPQSARNGIRVPLLARSGDTILPSFALALILNKEGLTSKDLKVQLNGSKSTIQVGDKYTIPIDAGGYLTVNASTRDLISDLEAASLILASSNFDIADDLRRAEQRDLDSLKTNAVLVGFDDEASRQFELADGSKISRAELLAMTVATIQSGRYITLWPDWLRIAVMILLGVLGILLMRWGRASVTMLGLLAGFVYLIVSMLIFQSTLSWTPPLAPLGICLVIALVGLFLPRAAESDAERKDEQAKDEPDVSPKKEKEEKEEEKKEEKKKEKKAEEKGKPKDGKANEKNNKKETKKE